MNLRTPLALSAALLLSAATAQAQSVLVVDDQPGPGVNFTSLTLAINAAQDGDVILLKPGDYYGDISTSGLRSYSIDGKSIDLVGDTGGAVRLRDSFFSVFNLGATQHVSITGIEFADASFYVQNCQGSVAVKNCDFPAFGKFTSSPAPMRTVQVKDTANFILEDSWIEGRQTSNAFGTGPADALVADNSNLFIYNSQVLGGKGLSGKTGGTGIRLNNSHLFASGGMILGGQAGDQQAFSGMCSTPGFGIILNPGSSAEAVNVRIAGGAGGNFCPPPLDKYAAPVLSAGAGLVITQKAHHGIRATSPVREGQTLTLGATGVFGEFIFLSLSASTVPLPLTGIPGMSYVDPAASVITALGKVTSTSEEQFNFPIAPMPLGVDAMALTAQLIFAEPSGSATVSGMARVVVLDSKF